MPEHAAGCPKLRPASARQPLGPRWPALYRPCFRDRPTTDAEFSLSTERQLDPDEEDGRLVTAKDDGTATMQRNWPKPLVETLYLGRNEMGDGAMAALVALLGEGAMPNLETLELQRNQISDAGVAALASALRGGALPACTDIRLLGNPGSRAPVQEALASPERAAALARRQAE